MARLSVLEQPSSDRPCFGSEAVDHRRPDHRAGDTRESMGQDDVLFFGVDDGRAVGLMNSALICCDEACSELAGCVADLERVDVLFL